MSVSLFCCSARLRHVANRIVLKSEHAADLQNFRSLRAAALERAAGSPTAVPIGPIGPLASIARTAPADPTPLSVPNQALWSEQRIHAHRSALGETSSAPPIEGVLRVPAVKLEVAVYTGTNDRTLDRGAGRIESTPALGSDGNVGIAAHRDGFFRALKDIQVGVAVFVDLATQTLRYDIVDIRVVRPEDVWVLAPTPEPTLTLVTCYPFYFVGAAPERLIVRAAISRAKTSRAKAW